MTEQRKHWSQMPQSDLRKYNLSFCWVNNNGSFWFASSRGSSLTHIEYQACPKNMEAGCCSIEACQCMNGFTKVVNGTGLIARLTVCFKYTYWIIFEEGQEYCSACEYNLVAVGGSILGQVWKISLIEKYNQAFVFIEDFCLCPGQNIKYRKMIVDMHIV